MTYSKRAFTVYEVLTSITIMVILAGIVLVVFGPGIAESKTTPGCASNLHQLAASYNLYLTDNDNRMPPNWGLIHQYQASKTNTPLLYCPLSHEQYYDVVSEANSYMNTGIILQSTMPNGTPIPPFKPDSDILARCFTHAYGGFQDGGLMQDLKGKVLGVRMDGTVSKAFPYSCWEVAYQSDRTLQQAPQFWQKCDSGS